MADMYIIWDRLLFDINNKYVSVDDLLAFLREHLQVL